MCEREKNEPLWQYWFRQFKEEPLRVMILATTAAMVWLYQDGNRQWSQYREDMWRQQELLLQHIDNTNKMLHGVEMKLHGVEMKIGSCDNRLLHLEREAENNRKP